MAFRYRHGERPLEGYTVLRGIGQGGFGEVYYARSDGGREVALKVIQQNHEIELRGVRQCMNLKSPYLVTIFDVRLDSDGFPFVIMEHIQGPSLRQVVQQSPRGLDVAKVAYLIREIGKGLSYLHEHGIVHRDLKPENIFFEEGYVKIGDYGLSKYISVSHQSGQTISVGSVHYMAPEIGSGHYQRSIDIYALGVMLYELLTGRVPFNGDSMGEILMKHLSCEPDLSAIEPRLRPIIQKALAKRPEDRYQRVEEMVEALLAADGVTPTLEGFQPMSLVASVAGGESAGADSRTETVEAAAGEEAAGRKAVGAAPPLEPPGPRAPLEPPGPRETPGETHAHSPQRPPRPEKGTEGGGLLRSKDFDQRLFISFVTAGAMALAVWLIAGERGRLPLWTAAVIAAGAIPILLVEGFLAPRFRLEAGMPRALARFAVAGPALAAALAATGLRGSMFALLGSLLLVDWTARLKPDRHERVSLEHAFTAGLFGFAVAMFTPGNPVFCAGILAAISLVLNAFAPFEPARKKTRKDKGPPGGHRDSPSGPAAAARAAAPAARPEPVRAPQPRPRQTAAAVAVAPAAPAAPPVVLTPPSRLVRTRDALLAGVCGGLAARYAIDVAWVRIGFLLAFFLTAGWALLAYIAMWICMPKAGRGERPARELARGGRRTHWPTTLLWSVLCPLSLFGALAALASSMEPLLYDRHAIEEHVALFGLGCFLALFGGFAFLKTRSRRRTSFWHGTLQPFVTLLLFSVAAGGTVGACKLVGEEWTVSVCLALSGGILGTLLGVGWLRWHRRQWLEDPRAPGGDFEYLPYQAHPGWQGLAVLFLALAFVSLAAGTLLASGAGPPAFAGLQHLGANWNPLDLGPSQRFLAFPLVLFLPGLFCLLMARRPGGAAHVLRGTLGAVSMALLWVGVAAFVETMFRDPDPGQVRFLGESMRQGELLFLLLGLGVAACLLLAWPARPMRVARSGSASTREYPVAEGF